MNRDDEPADHVDEAEAEWRLDHSRHSENYAVWYCHNCKANGWA